MQYGQRRQDRPTTRPPTRPTKRTTTPRAATTRPPMLNDVQYEEEPVQELSREIMEVENSLLHALNIFPGAVHQPEARPEVEGKSESEAGEVGLADDVRFLQKNGEFYINPFDFFQQIQRWMYKAGMFNIF